MNVLFCGLGSIGQRHAGLLRRHFGANILAVRSRKGQAAAPSFPVEEVDRLDHLQGRDLDAAFVTNPTNLHGPTTIRLIRLGVRRIFLEKPVESDLDRLEALRTEARKSAAAVYAGYFLRFHPVLLAIRQRLGTRRVRQVRITCSSWLPNWRPGQDHRRSYSADARRGGGVLLDLSHELDYLEFITGRTIACIEGRAGNSGALGIRAEDRADLLVRLSDGTPANVHLDFCSLAPERRVQVDWEGGHLEGDLLSGLLSDTRAPGPKPHRVLACRGDDPYLAQIRFFLRAPARRLRTDFERTVNMTRRLLRFRRQIRTNGGE